MREKIIFAYEWESDKYSLTKNPSVSNGQCDREEYFRFVQDYVTNVEKTSGWRGMFEASERAPEISNTEEFYSGRHFEFMHIDSIPEGTKYCYNIPVKNHDTYFVPKFKNGFRISERVRKDVSEGRALIILDYRTEGFLKIPQATKFKDFRDICSKLNLPKHRVLFFHGDYNTPGMNSAYYTYYPMNKFMSWIEYDFKEIIDYLPNKLFLTYNRNLNDQKLHRVFLLLYLYRENLMDHGTVSVGSNTITFQSLLKFYVDVTSDEIKVLSDMNNTSPDGINLERNCPAFDIIEEHYKTSFVSVVSETLYHNDISFFTEKTYKPLSIGHPFIINGNPFSLHRLRSEGFRTFSQWWDESYDNETRVEVRVKKIVDILVRLSKMSTNELVEMRHQMRETLEYNQKLFYELREKNYYTLYDLIQKVL